MSRDQLVLIGHVRQEIERMRNAASSAAPDAQVSMPSGQFLKLAALFEELCNALEASASSDEGRLGDTRYWVPLASFEQLKADHVRLQRFTSFGANGLLDLVELCETDFAGHS